LDSVQQTDPGMNRDQSANKRICEHFYEGELK